MVVTAQQATIKHVPQSFARLSVEVEAQTNWRPVLQNLFQNNYPVNRTRQCTISSEYEIRENVIDPRDAPNIANDADPPSIVRLLICSRLYIPCCA